MIAFRAPIPDADAEEQYGIRCGDCGSAMVLRRSRDGRPFWGCSTWPACSGTHGAHPSGAPLGVPGDRATRAARIEAHRVFDAAWRARGMDRTAAYRWLDEIMGVPRGRAHISRMTAAQCGELIARLELAEATRELLEAAQ